MLRLGGKKIGALTLLLDMLKGLLPLVLVKLWFHDVLMLSAVFLGVFLGHLYPLFFGFKGGKGVATYLGGLFALSYPLALMFIGVWMSAAILFRYSSLAALLATVGVLSWSLYQAFPWTAVLVPVTVFIFWRHRANITRLCQGTEPKIFQR